MDLRGARSGYHGNVTEIKALFHLLTCNFASFGRFACFGRFGRFGRFVSVVSLVSVVSFVSVVSVVSFRWFRPFHFVVSGFSTCRDFETRTAIGRESFVC